MNKSYLLRNVFRVTLFSRANISPFKLCDENFVAEIPPRDQDILWPPSGEHLLPAVSKTPTYDWLNSADDIKATTKRLIEIRGPELVHTEFWHKQYGVIAETGGFMKFEHFEYIRNHINMTIDPTKMFAIWRVDGPWLPRVKRSQGTRLRNYKGNVKSFVTPVRSGRVIIELGGRVTSLDAKVILNPIVRFMPLWSRKCGYDEMAAERDEEKRLSETNENPFTFDYSLKWNMGNCSSFVSKYDYIWGGKHR